MTGFLCAPAQGTCRDCEKDCSYRLDPVRARSRSYDRAAWWWAGLLALVLALVVACATRG